MAIRTTVEIFDRLNLEKADCSQGRGSRSRGGGRRRFEAPVEEVAGVESDAEEIGRDETDCAVRIPMTQKTAPFLAAMRGS